MDLGHKLLSEMEKNEENYFNVFTRFTRLCYSASVSEKTPDTLLLTLH